MNDDPKKETEQTTPPPEDADDDPNVEVKTGKPDSMGKPHKKRDDLGRK